MMNLDDEMTQTMDVMTPHRENQSLNTARVGATVEDRTGANFTRDNTRVVSNAPFSPVYASPDDVNFQREEQFEPQFFPR
jgi:hypothetical protein